MGKTMWKDIPDWEGFYQVSDKGKVRSLDRIVPSKNGSSSMKRGKILAPTPHRGYLAVTLRKAPAFKTIKIHTAVLISFVGEKPRGLEARHLNGNCLDNRLSNLCWGTKSENGQDKILHGTHHNANKTHCPRNHEYSSQNTYISPDGARNCRACRRKSQLEYKKRNK